MTHIVTRESVVAALADERPRFVVAYVGKALVVLFNRQTREEASSNTTKEHNTIGFAGCDARSGSITAKYFLKHKTLLDWQVAQWAKPNVKGIPRLAKYWRQLDAEAQRKVRPS